MRYGLIVLGIAFIFVALHQNWGSRLYDELAASALSEDARLAIDVGCRGRNGRSKRDCQDMLRKLYLSGSLDPDKTLRAYCEEVEHGRWGGSRPPAPELCVRRYGGWQEG